MLSYKALYRVFRPQTFGDLCGQEHISKTLRNALIKKRLAHAYLFCGPRGTGKTSSAKILAKAVNCLNLQDGEPCNECANCKAINNDSFLDVIEIDAASNRGIDEMRQIRDKINFAPSEGLKKVYIIDEVHMLTNEAFNALLKTLEEPPEHILFILATTDPQKIPATILSRTQRFDFRKISIEEIKTRLNLIASKEDINLSANACSIIALKAEGGMRDAISILDQCIAYGGNTVDVQEVQSVLGALGDGDIAKIFDSLLNLDGANMLAILNEYLLQGKDIRQILNDIVNYVRDLMLLKVGSKVELVSITEADLPLAQAQIKKFSLQFLSAFLNRLAQAQKEIRYAQNGQILVETALIDALLLLEGKDVEIKTQVPKVNETKIATNVASKVNMQTIQASNTSEPKIKLINASEIINKWQNIMLDIKKESIKLYAFLDGAKPTGISDGALILKFDKEHKFHADKVSQDENKRLIEKVLNTYTKDFLAINVYCEKVDGEFENKYDILTQAKAVFGNDVVILEE